MGAPSGSKNCSVLTDAHDLRNLREFEKGSVDDSHIRSDSFSSEPQSWREEKMLRASELLEFRKAKVATDRPVRKLMPKPSIDAPQPENKRRLPSFLKMKSKDSDLADLDAKRARTDASPLADGTPSPGDSSPLPDAPEAPEAAAEAAANVKAAVAKPLGGLGGLGGYASDSEEGESSGGEK